MTAFPRSPRLTKGALVSMDKLRAPVVVVFQYNPETLSRTVSPKWGELRGEAGDALRLHGAAAQTIDLEILLDASDRLENNDPTTMTLGLMPDLAALETMLYPPSAQVLANALLERAGTIELLPPSGPLTILIWGVQRIMPVRVQSLSIKEEAHDPHLNPLRARASMNLQVLTWSDFESTHPGYWLSMAHQQAQEALALMRTVAGAADLAPVKLKVPLP